MGVPTAWLQNAAQRQLTTGIVVMDQTGKDPKRYVMVDGAALYISGTEWTADEYNTQTLMGVPGEWLKAAAKKVPSTGTVLMDQSGTDPSRYVMLNGAALHISAAEWTANGYDKRSLMGVPGGWLASTVATQVSNGTIVKDASGADSTVYVMAGGVAVPLTYADFTAFGYDKRPLEGAPGEWLRSAAAKAAPADGTMLLSPDSNTVWQVTMRQEEGDDRRPVRRGQAQLQRRGQRPERLHGEVPHGLTGTRKSPARTPSGARAGLRPSALADRRQDLGDAAGRQGAARRRPAQAARAAHTMPSGRTVQARDCCSGVVAK